MRTADDLVRVEVHYCVSSLVDTLAKGHGGLNEELGDIAEQAFELSTPIEDWEEAAIQAGWHEDHWGHWVENGNEDQDSFANAQECCEGLSLDPYEREVYEHWIVSDWLADKLAENGEKVDKDFAGLTVWARTTTGQTIAMDSVIQKIVADLNGTNAEG